MKKPNKFSDSMMVLMRRLTYVVAMLSLPFSASSAGYFQSADWVWSRDSADYYSAATVNAAGHVLGQYCYFSSASCFYLVSFGTTCEEGRPYPAILNSDAGSAAVTLVCAYKVQGGHVQIISGFDDADHIIRAGTRIGIAVPLLSDQFKVSRFSLVGSTQALDLMRAAAEAKMNRKPYNSSKPPPEEFL